MVILYNRNITKQLNSYFLRISIILQCLLQSTKPVLSYIKLGCNMCLQDETFNSNNDEVVLFK